MKRLCTVCARGGSKGVEGKNLRMVAGRPLIAHTLMQASDSGLFDAIAVSSDSPEILEVAELYGADQLVTRPVELASDTAAKLPAIRHCVEIAERNLGWRAATVVDLDATSPLREPSDIIEAVELLEIGEAPNVITASPARRSPYFNLVEVGENGHVSLSKSLQNQIVRRQDAPKCFDLNASIYVWRRDSLFAELSLFQQGTLLHVMPEERSLDIDSPLDWTIVKFLMEARN